MEDESRERKQARIHSLFDGLVIPREEKAMGDEEIYDIQAREIRLNMHVMDDVHLEKAIIFSDESLKAEAIRVWGLRKDKTLLEAALRKEETDEDAWRQETSRVLEEELENNPTCRVHDTSSLRSWRALVGAKLSFNTELQGAFFDASMTVLNGWSDGRYYHENRGLVRQSEQKMLAILEQAIQELRHPSRTIQQAPSSTTVDLVEDHSLLWFIIHCHWKTKVQLGVTVFGLLTGAFTMGFFAGKNAFFSKVYDAWTSQTLMEAQNSITAPSTTKNETNLKTDSATESKD